MKQQESISDDIVNECLYLPVADYQRRYRQRRTWVEIDGKREDAAVLFGSIAEPKVAYPNFRQRLLRLAQQNALSTETALNAARMAETDWMTFYGGGRRRSFIYDGEIYAEQYGKTFSSISAFLKTVGRYKDRNNVWDRLKARWHIDTALEEPISPSSNREGSIYKITRRSTGELYIGLTILPIKVRWHHHFRRAQDGAATPLAKAIQSDGESGFTMEAIETGLAWDALPGRERYWIATLNTRQPLGLNASIGGQIGGGKRKRITWGNEEFGSMEDAAHILSKRTGLAKHVVLTRLQRGEPLPDRARVHSNHPDAGSNLWRRWKSLLNATTKGVRSGSVSPAWVDYEIFKRDVSSGYMPALELVRVDDNEPWGPSNFNWITRGERIAHSMGKKISVRGVEYSSISALAKAFGLHASTLKNRIAVQGMSAEEAVETALGPTSSKRVSPIVMNGEVFSSVTAAARHLAKQHGLTVDQARDRLRRGKPLTS